MDNGPMKSNALPLISENYRAQQAQLHAQGNYGVMGEKHAGMVNAIIERMGVRHLLDYGCGSRCSLTRGLKALHKLTYQAYDPGVPKFASPPVPAEMVCCIDVLEHIEPDYLDAVLDDLRRLTEAILFATVATGPAGKTLSDGRNAHLTQQPMSWWAPKFFDRFEVQTIQVLSPKDFLVIGYAKSQIQTVNGGLA